MKTITKSGQFGIFGESLKLPLEFEFDGLLITPDDGSVTYSLTAIDGSQLKTDIAIVSGETSLTIAATDNAQVGSEKHSARFLVFNFTEDLQPRTITFNYHLRLFIPITVIPSQVRGVLGLSVQELGDTDIDLFATVQELDRDLSEPLFTDPTKNYESNSLLLAKECLKQSHTIYLKVLQKNKIDDHTKERLIKVNLGALVETCKARYLEAYQSFTGVSIAEQPLLTLIQTRSDPVTG